MVIFYILFIIVTVFGLSQMYTSYKQKARTKDFLNLLSNQPQTKSAFETKLLKSNMGVAFLDFWGDFFYYLRGNTRQDTMRNLVVLAIVLGLVFYFNSTSLLLPEVPTLFVTTILTCYFIYVGAKKKARVEFETSFAEALNIIGSAVSVGNTVISGIQQCGNKLSDTHLGQVFKKIHQRMEIGEDIENVLLDAYSELHYREFFFFAIAVIINMKGGGQLKEIMSRLSQIITNGRVMEKKLLAKTSEARMSIKILAIMPLAMFFILKYISPENFDVLVNTSGGNAILIYSTISTLLGISITWTMMNKV